MTSRYQADIDVDVPNNTHSSLVALTGENHQVLELGAASGYMTKVLRQRGCEVTAVEFDPDAVDDLKTVANSTVVGDLNDPGVLDAIDGPFDVVLAGDVLEHLVDPLAVLRSCVGKLKTSGSVVISLPNVAHVDLKLSLMQGMFDYRGTGLLDDTHLRFFTYRTMLDLIDQAGLIVTDIRRIVVHPFESELAVSRGSVTPSVLEAALALPDSETYQFVVRAVRDTGDPALQKESKRALAAGIKEDQKRLREVRESPGGKPLERHVEELNRMLQEVVGELDAARAAYTQIDMKLAATETEMSSALARVEDLEKEVCASRRELLAACIGEAQRVRLKAENEVLVATVDAVRSAAGLPATDTDLSEAVAVIRARSFRLAMRGQRLLARATPRSSHPRRAMKHVIQLVRGPQPL